MCSEAVQARIEKERKYRVACFLNYSGGCFNPGELVFDYSADEICYYDQQGEKISGISNYDKSPCYRLDDPWYDEDFWYQAQGFESREAVQA